jgi:hypothetical protein
LKKGNLPETPDQRRLRLYAEVYGWHRRTRDRFGHIWAFIGYRIVDPNDWYGREKTIERATWECTECGLHMFMDCTFPLKGMHNIEPVPGSLTWSCGSSELCWMRQAEQGIRECHDYEHTM